MKLWQKVLLGIAGFVVALLAVGFVLPSSARVERSRAIAASPEVVMTHVSDFRRWPAWSPWVDQDPNMTWRYAGPQQGVGATQIWSGPKAGRGKMTLTKVTPRGVEYDLWFDDNPVSNPGGITLEPGSAGTKVTWYFTTDFGQNPLARWFGLLLDNLVGSDFERGLRKLDELVTEQASR